MSAFLKKYLDFDANCIIFGTFLQREREREREREKLLLAYTGYSRVVYTKKIGNHTRPQHCFCNVGGFFIDCIRAVFVCVNRLQIIIMMNDTMRRDRRCPVNNRHNANYYSSVTSTNQLFTKTVLPMI
jgi:hypothetical protein